MQEVVGNPIARSHMIHQFKKPISSMNRLPLVVFQTSGAVKWALFTALLMFPTVLIN